MGPPRHGSGPQLAPGRAFLIPVLIEPGAFLLPLHQDILILQRPNSTTRATDKLRTSNLNRDQPAIFAQAPFPSLPQQTTLTHITTKGRKKKPATMASSSDFFDDVLHLEDKFYADGHRQGVADGERAGRAEGRAFGIEKGFDKFVEAGRLYGRALVWANRLPRAQQDRQPVVPPASPSAAAAAAVPPLGDGTREAPPQEPPLLLPVLTTGGARLEKNVLALHALVEPETLSTENADDAVNDFDDRVKRAQGKARVIERQTGEDAAVRSAEAKSTGGAVTTTAATTTAVQQQQQPSSASASSSSAAAAPPTGEVGF